MHHHDKVRAFVLHQRRYRETSLLVDLLTADQGLVRVVANGALRPSSLWRGILQSFIPLAVSFSIRHDLGTLKQAEITHHCNRLKARYLLSGLYINELLMRLLHPHAPVPDLFQAYQSLHQGLVNASEMSESIFWEQDLRIFEKHLLSTLGVVLDFQMDCNTGHEIKADKYYRFIPESGFILSEKPGSEIVPSLFQGSTLLALAEESFSTVSNLQEAKRLMRLVFKSLLGDRHLRSRSLFILDRSG
ncbi:MAG: repair protein RecO [Gammaproteobacteria bacterium]|nr:repair protein RecO [Gammaproteobacteria bacterium]